MQLKTTASVLTSLLLVGCMSNPHREVAQVCGAYGWQSGQCRYAQRASLQQQAHGQALIRQGLRQMPKY